MPGVTLSDAARKVLLKLDSGALIGCAERLKVDAPAASAVIISADQTFGLGRLSEKDVQRLENILLQMHAKVPHAQPLRTASAAIESLKRKASDIFQEPTPRSHHVNGNGYAAFGEPLSPRDDGVWAKGTFEGKCLQIIQACWVEFGEFIIYFNEPVKTSVVPDYYRVIKQPRDLGSIKRKLQRKQFDSPQQFYDDMHLFFSNIYTYNGAASNFGKLGSRVEALFEERWAASGLAGGAPRARRMTAGHAAAKFEPDLTPPEKRTLPRASSGGGGGGAPRSGGGPGARSGKSGGARSRGNEKEMPRETLERIASQLGNLDGDHLQGALDIIRAVTPLGDGQTDEIELDFDSLDAPTLWRLEAYLRSLNTGNGNFQVEDESESDSSSGSDSD